jgi:hypothetical protein
MKDESDTFRPRIPAWLAAALAGTAVMAVIVYEVIKASHHATYVGFNRNADWPLTGFWIMDGVVATIVTFALVWVSLSFERMEEHLRHQRQESKVLSDRFDHTTINLIDTNAQLLNVARTVAAAGGIIKSLNSPELWEVLKKDTSLAASFMGNLNNIAEVWSTLLSTEGKNEFSVFGDQNLSLACWSVAIDTYLKEEVRDISNRTIATNIGVYIKLIEQLVQSVLIATRDQEVKIELFASAILLPMAYYDWKEYGTDEKEFSATYSEFMDGYRTAIKHWIKNEPKVTFSRVLLVQDKVPSPCQILVNDLAIPTLSDLRTQSTYKIICKEKDHEPALFTIDELAAYVDVKPGLLQLHGQDCAYAIHPKFHAGEQMKNAGFEEQDLIDIFVRELHTDSANARCLIINSEDRANRLNSDLPTIYGGFGEPREMKCPDFLAIRVNDRPVACIAARLKPNYDTMLLRLITEQPELERINQFIAFALDGSQSDSMIAAVNK